MRGGKPVNDYTMFKPWKGCRYDDTRLLLLGESAYSWKEHGGLKHPPIDHCCKLVQWVVDDFRGCASNGRFMATLSRALTNEVSPPRKTLRFVWNRVAFTNYVPGTVGCGPRIRPNNDAWKKAADALPKLLDQLQPRCVIVLGKGMWDRMPETHIWFTNEVQGYRLSTGNVAMCWAVKHPAAGLKWQELSALIHFAYQQVLDG
jgi:hypothetical protein